MDAIAWIVTAGVVVVAIVFISFGPRLMRSTRKRQESGGLGGIAAGFDAVWRPNATLAHQEWQASVERTIPVPSPEDHYYTPQSHTTYHRFPLGAYTGRPVSRGRDRPARRRGSC